MNPAQKKEKQVTALACDLARLRRSRNPLDRFRIRAAEKQLRKEEKALISLRRMFPKPELEIDEMWFDDKLVATMEMELELTRLGTKVVKRFVEVLDAGKN